MEKKTDYSKGKIYKIQPIYQHEEGDIYIGSTCKHYLSHRMAGHRYNYRCWKKGIFTKVQSFELFDKYGIENCEIVLLESVIAKSKDELLAREKHYIKSLNCVNKYIPGRNATEYYQDNREKVAVYKKNYYEDNIEILTAYKKKYRQDNKEKIHQHQSTVCVCDICKCNYTKANKARHQKTQVHLIGLRKLFERNFSLIRTIHKITRE